MTKTDHLMSLCRALPHVDISVELPQDRQSGVTLEVLTDGPASHAAFQKKGGALNGAGGEHNRLPRPKVDFPSSLRLRDDATGSPLLDNHAFCSTCGENTCAARAGLY